MARPEQTHDLAAARKVARRYRALGYEVQEHPGPELLPEFMRGATPDIVARSTADNVVVEVKTHGALKGANDIVEIAERVAQRPGWRFELVVLDDAEAASARSAVDIESARRKTAAASAAGLLDLGYLYLANALVLILRDLARRHGVRAQAKTDRGLVADLAFKGVLPEALAGACIAVLERKDGLGIATGEAPSVSETNALLRLCDEVQALI